MIYTLDTSIIVDAVRDPAERVRFKRFLEWALPRTVLSSVVASELLAGARTVAARRLVEAELLAPFERRGRIVAPSVTAWHRTGVLRGEEGGRRIGPDWQNDLLLAHSARELGWAVVTRDADFTTLRAHVRGLRVVAPYPRHPAM